MKTDYRTLLGSLFTNVGPLAPLLLLAAIVSVYFAAVSAKGVAGTLHSVQNSSPSTVTIQRSQIDEGQALLSAQKLAKLSPATTISVAGKYVVVTIAKPEQFAEWMHAMTELQSTADGVLWEADDVCVASCEGGEAARAFVTAYRQQLKVN